MPAPFDSLLQRGLGEAELEAIRARLKRAVSRICPHWLRAMSDDLVQAAMAKVIESIKVDSSHPQPPSAYLERVAYSVLVDEIRRQRRRPEATMEPDTMERSTEPERVGPERLLLSKEISKHIQGCIEKLAEERRMAVTLRLLGHTVQEIHKSLGWSAKRAENMTLRGLSDLRRCLAANGIAP